LQDELQKAVQDHPTLAMSEAPYWGRENSASHQWGGGSSSSLFSAAFHLSEDNTNSHSHVQAAEVNVFSWETHLLQNLAEWNAAVQNIAPEYGVLTGMQKMGYHPTDSRSTWSVPIHAALL